MSVQHTYLLEDNIHEFVFQAANRKVVDDYVDLLLELLPELQPDEPWLSILDMSTHGIVPLRYALSKVNSLTAPYLADRVNRTLLIHNAGTMGQLAHTLVNPLNNNVRFLTPEKREQGIAWLLQQQMVSE